MAATKKIRGRKTIESDPLASLSPDLARAAPKTTQPAPATPSAAKTTQPAPATPSAAKVRTTFILPEDLSEELRDAVVYLAGPPERMTLAALAEHALRRELERLRAKHRGGKPFPRRDADLKGGRPIGR